MITKLDDFTITTIDDKVGAGVKIAFAHYGVFHLPNTFEARTKGGFETKIYNPFQAYSNIWYAVVHAPVADGTEYNTYKTLVDKLNKVYDLGIGNKKSDFVDFLIHGVSYYKEANSHDAFRPKQVKFKVISHKRINYKRIENSAPQSPNAVSSPGLGRKLIGLITGKYNKKTCEELENKKEEIKVVPDWMQELSDAQKKCNHLKKISEETSNINDLVKLNEKLTKAKSYLKLLTENAIRRFRIDDVNKTPFYNTSNGIFVLLETTNYDEAYDFLDYMINGGEYVAAGLSKGFTSPSPDTDLRKKEVQQAVQKELVQAGIKPTNVIDMKSVPKDEINMEAQP